MLLMSWLGELCRGGVNVCVPRGRRSVQAARSYADVQILESRRLLTNITAMVVPGGTLVVADSSSGATNDVTLEYHLTSGQPSKMDFFLKGSGATTINGQADYDVTANLASFNSIQVWTNNNNDTIRIDTTNQGFNQGVSAFHGGIALVGSYVGSNSVGATGNNVYDFVSTNFIGNVVVDDITGIGNLDKLDFSTSSDVQLNLGTTAYQEINKNNINLNLALTSNTISSNINLIGGKVTNTLTAGFGQNVTLDASGSSGVNVLTGSSKGNVTLKGGSGNNHYVFPAPTGVDLNTVVQPNRNATDRFNFSALTTDLIVNLATMDGTTDATALAFATSFRVYTGAPAQLSNIVSVDGGQGNNVLTAGSGTDTLTGGAGNNIFNTGTGIDQLIGTNGTTNSFVFSTNATNVTIAPSNSGTNTLDFRKVSSPLTVDLSANTAIGSYGTATVSAVGTGQGRLFQAVIGGTGNNALTGGSGQYLTLDASGSSGTNTLTAGNSGNDILKGGSGVNSYKFGDAIGVSLDTIVPGTGTNSIDFSNVTSAPDTPLQVNLATRGGVNDSQDILWLAFETNRRVYVQNGVDANAFQRVIGSTNAGGANQLTAGAGPNVTLDASGSTGINVLTAGSGTDTLIGGAGANTFNTGSNTEQLIGANGTTNVFVFMDNTTNVTVTPSNTGTNTLDFRRVSFPTTVDLTAKTIIAWYGAATVSTSGMYQGSLFQSMIRLT